MKFDRNFFVFRTEGDSFVLLPSTGNNKLSRRHHKIPVYKWLHSRFPFLTACVCHHCIPSQSTSACVRCPSKSRDPALQVAITLLSSSLPLFDVDNTLTCPLYYETQLEMSLLLSRCIRACTIPTYVSHTQIDFTTHFIRKSKLCHILLWSALLN
jgi:hypothetical protein